MENTEQNTVFHIEEYHRGEDPLDLEIVTYAIKDQGNQTLFVVESHITLDEKLDGLVINKVAIPVDPDEPQADVPATQLASILATLADEGLLEPGEPVHLDMPGEYVLRLDEPYKIGECYYQKGYEAETTNWLREFLIRDVTIARILAMLDSEEEK